MTRIMSKISEYLLATTYNKVFEAVTKQSNTYRSVLSAPTSSEIINIK